MKIRIKRQELISDFPYIVQCENDSYYWVTVAMVKNATLAANMAQLIKHNRKMLDGMGYLFL